MENSEMNENAEKEVDNTSKDVFSESHSEPIEKNEPSEMGEANEESQNVQESVKEDVKENLQDVSPGIKKDVLHCCEDEEPKKEPEKQDKNDDAKKDEGAAGKKKKPWGWIIFGVILIVLIVVMFFLYMEGEKQRPANFTNFTYNGFLFKKVPLGSSYVYETGLIIMRNGNPFEYNFRFRTDPRILGQIPANISPITKTAYFSFTPETTNCSGDALIAAFQLGQFLSNIGVDIQPAVTENFSGNNLSVKNCSSALSKSVVVLMPFSAENRIYPDPENKNCVIIEAKNCSVIATSERYILAIMERYKKPDQFKEVFQNISG